MSGSSFEAWAGLALVAVAVKLCDDLIDLPRDRASGRLPGNWAARLRGSGAAAAYGMIALALGVSLAGRLGLLAFLAAYGVGMVRAGEWGRRLPSGLAGWQEALAVLGLAAWLGPWTEVLGLSALLIACQILDDELDRRGRPVALPFRGASVPPLVPRAVALLAFLIGVLSLGFGLSGWILALGLMISLLSRPGRG